jgi:hypothetical protein
VTAREIFEEMAPLVAPLEQVFERYGQRGTVCLVETGDLDDAPFLMQPKPFPSPEKCRGEMNPKETRRTMKYIAIVLAFTFAALAQQPVVLREGTEVRLRFVDSLSSKTAVLDDPVALEVTDDVRVGDATVIHAGAHALGFVSNAKKSGMLGKPGELNIRLESVKAGDTKVHIRGTKGREGDGKVGEAVALTVLFGPVGLLKHGKNIDIAAGTPLTAYVTDDVAIKP